MARRTLIACGAALFTIVASVGAQRQGGSAPQNPTATPSDEIKATGCLAKDASGRFTLNDAAIEVTPWYAPGAPASRGAGPSNPLPSKTTFVLENGTGLDQQVGHKIQVTGKPAPSTANVAPTPDTILPPAPERGRGPEGAAAGGAAPAGAAAGANARGRAGTPRTYLPRLDVESFKMIAATCQ